MTHRPLLASAALVGAVLLLTGAGCASTSDSPAFELPGCYYFTQDDVFRELRLPWGIRLQDAPLEGWPAMTARGGRKATTLTGTDEVDHPFGYWLTEAPDSVEIGYPAGGGLVLELAVREDHGLEGTARPVGDVIEPGADGEPAARPVHLLWARCPEE